LWPINVGTRALSKANKECKTRALNELLRKLMAEKRNSKPSYSTFRRLKQFSVQLKKEKGQLFKSTLDHQIS
jgi:hypothetical protein